MRRRLMPLVGAVFVVACSPQAEPPSDPGPPPLSADHLANLIAADGAAHTVAVLTGPADPTGIDKVFAGIATGSPDWLAVVPAIKPELDDPDARSLQQALAKALLHNAQGVLALIPDQADVAIICAPTTPPETLTVAAVQAVTDPAVQSARAECLRALGQPAG